MAPSVSTQLADTAPYHLALLRTLEELQYAPSALEHQTKYISELLTELGKVKGEVQVLSEKTKKERKEHEILRDSTTRRLAAKLKGKGGVEKLEAKKEKEEREYVEALETEMRERGNQKMLESMIEDAKQVKADLQEKSQRLELTKSEISNLYHQVFDGPTREFPRDDVLEKELATAQKTYDQIQTILNAHSQSVNLLSQADQMLTLALRKMDEALSYSTWDVYGGGTISDMMERDALANAAMYTSKAEILIRQAQRTSTDVQSIGQLRVHDISIFGDVFFDNVFSDIRAHHKIQNNKKELTEGHTRLKGQLRAARQRAQLAGADLLEASEVLAECNKELEAYRRGVFLRYSSGGTEVSESESLTMDGEDLPKYGETSHTVSVTPETLLAASTSARSPPPPPFSKYAPPPGPPPPRRGRSTRPTMSSTSSSLSVPSPESVFSSHRRSRSSVSVTSSLNLLPQPAKGGQDQSKYQAHRRSQSSTDISHSRVSSSASSSLHPSLYPDRASSTETLDRQKALPVVPPSTPSSNISTSALGPVTGQEGKTVHAGEGSSPSISRPVTPNAVPAHWGSKNPFAMMMMG